MSNATHTTQQWGEATALLKALLLTAGVCCTQSSGSASCHVQQAEPQRRNSEVTLQKPIHTPLQH